MSHCMDCGTELPVDAQFCFKCGKPLSRPQEPQAISVGGVASNSETTNIPIIQGTPQTLGSNDPFAPEQPGMAGAGSADSPLLQQSGGLQAARVGGGAVPSQPPPHAVLQIAVGKAKGTRLATRYKLLLITLGVVIVIGGGFALIHRATMPPVNTFTVTGSLSGTMVVDEFEGCGYDPFNQTSYDVDIHGALNGASYEIEVIIDNYTGPGIYTNPSQIGNSRFVSNTNVWGGFDPDGDTQDYTASGSITIDNGGASGSISSLVLNGLREAAGTQIQVSGSWKCAPIGEPVNPTP